MLYGRSLALADEFQSAASKLSAAEQTSVSEASESIASLRSECALARGQVHAQALLEQAEKVASNAVSKPAATAAAEGKEATVSAPLLSRLDAWDAGQAATHHSLLSFPPEFVAAPTKPILFDLAFNAIEYPDISHKLRQFEKAPAAAAAAPAQKPKAAPAPAKQATPAASAASSSAAPAAAKSKASGPGMRTFAPPGEKESVRQERERLAREEEERRRQAEEEAKKKKGWGIGGLVGKLWGGGS